MYTHENICLGKRFVPEMNGAAIEPIGRNKSITFDLNLVHSVEDEHYVNELERKSKHKFMRVVHKVQIMQRSLHNLQTMVRASSALQASATESRIKRLGEGNNNEVAMSTNGSSSVNPAR